MEKTNIYVGIAIITPGRCSFAVDMYSVVEHKDHYETEMPTFFAPFCLLDKEEEGRTILLNMETRCFYSTDKDSVKVWAEAQKDKLKRKLAMWMVNADNAVIEDKTV